MSFIVPVLQPHLYGDFQFGACKISATIPDPGGAPGTGVVHLRGAVRADPLYSPSPNPVKGLQPLFTLPAGMRPKADRWFTCQLTAYTGLFNAEPALCVVLSTGEVLARSTGGSDGALFLDGVSFVAEQ